MNYTCFTILVIGVIILLALLNKYFAFAIVRGFSMMPNYKNNEIVLIKRRYVLTEGKVYLIKFAEFAMLKRLEKIKLSPKTGETSLYFLGDNLEDSWDSRYFGWQSSDVVMGEALKLKELIRYERRSNT